jgi:hypothetical protein
MHRQVVDSDLGRISVRTTFVARPGPRFMRVSTFLRWTWCQGGRSHWPLAYTG